VSSKIVMTKERNARFLPVLKECMISVPIVREKHKLKMPEDRVLKIIYGRRSRKKHDWKIKNKLTLRPFSNHILLWR